MSDHQDYVCSFPEDDDAVDVAVRGKGFDDAAEAAAEQYCDNECQWQETVTVEVSKGSEVQRFHVACELTPEFTAVLVDKTPVFQ